MCVYVCCLTEAKISATSSLVSVSSIFLTLQIYSKVNNILRVDLYDTNTECDILINDVLIDEGFAVKCEEPYQSKVTLTYLHVSLWEKQARDGLWGRAHRLLSYEIFTRE